MTHIETCGRCDSKIVEASHGRPEKMQFYREHKDGTYESQEIRLCSICINELWEFVFETELDRSDKADPVGIAKMGNSVNRHIEELQNILNELEALLDEEPKDCGEYHPLPCGVDKDCADLEGENDK